MIIIKDFPSFSNKNLVILPYFKNKNSGLDNDDSYEKNISDKIIKLKENLLCKNISKNEDDIICEQACKSNSYLIALSKNIKNNYAQIYIEDKIKKTL